MKRYFIYCMLLIAQSGLSADLEVLSLNKMLSLAQSNSESISLNVLNEIVAQQGVDIASSRFYPTMDFEAIETHGFPGSSNISGMRGLMNSPFRKGPSAGVKAEQVVWDFGRTSYAIKVAEFQTQYAKENTRLTAMQVQNLALQAFYECAFYQSQINIWDNLLNESKTIAKESIHFVNTGQRTIVDKYISTAQTEEAYTSQVYYQALVKNSIKKISVITGLPNNTFTCPVIEKVLDSPFNEPLNLEESPYITRARIGVEIAQAELKHEKSEFMPEILAIGSAGYMQGTNFESIPIENYAVGIAIDIPLFNMKFSGQIKQAEAEYNAKLQEIKAERQNLEEMNASYDEVILSTSSRLAALQKELKNANEGYGIAKKRYFSLQTDLYDLQTMYTILAKIQNEVGMAQAQILIAQGEKALLNGARTP